MAASSSSSSSDGSTAEAADGLGLRRTARYIAEEASGTPDDGLDTRDGTIAVDVNESESHFATSTVPSLLPPQPHAFGFPASVFFILGNELCERFSFYGLRAVLVVYLMSVLQYTEDESATIFHGFVVAAYLSPILGGVVADSWWGRYTTIWRLSLLYCAGGAMLALWLDRAGMFLGLSLIALGTGGIKPCVISFGADQLVTAPAAVLSSYFALFYLSINMGSLVSTFLTPLLRTLSFTAAFGLPAVLLFVGTAIFVGGSRLYLKFPPAGNVALVNAAKCIMLGLRRRFTHGMRGVHWLEHPDVLAQFGAEQASAVRRLVSIFLVFLPLPVFWACFDQHSSRWVQQAGLMCRDIGQWTVYPDQVPVLNPLCVVILVPLFDKAVFPAMRKRGFNINPLWRMFVGMILTALSFILAGILQIAINSSLPGEILHEQDWSTRVDRVSDLCRSTDTASKPPHVSWQFIQFIVLTTGEILVSISGLEFASTQAPASMKAVVQALWLFTTSFGNLLVAVFAILSLFSQAGEYFFYATLMMVFALIFSVMAKRYSPVRLSSEHELEMPQFSSTSSLEE